MCVAAAAAATATNNNKQQQQATMSPIHSLSLLNTLRLYIRTPINRGAYKLFYGFAHLFCTESNTLERNVCGADAVYLLFAANVWAEEKN